MPQYDLNSIGLLMNQHINSRASNVIEKSVFDQFICAVLTKNFSAAQALIKEEYISFSHLPEQYQGNIVAGQVVPYSVLTHLLFNTCISDEDLAQTVSLFASEDLGQLQIKTHLNLLPQFYSYVLGYKGYIKSYKYLQNFNERLNDDDFWYSVLNYSPIKNTKEFLVSVFTSCPSILRDFLTPLEHVSKIKNLSELEREKYINSLPVAQLLIKYFLAQRSQFYIRKDRMPEYIQNLALTESEKIILRERVKLETPVLAYQFLEHRYWPEQKIFYLLSDITHRPAIISAILECAHLLEPHLLKEFKASLAIVYRCLLPLMIEESASALVREINKNSLKQKVHTLIQEALIDNSMDIELFFNLCPATMYNRKCGVNKLKDTLEYLDLEAREKLILDFKIGKSEKKFTSLKV